jgi:hypothetical protein
MISTHRSRRPSSRARSSGLPDCNLFRGSSVEAVTCAWRHIVGAHRYGLRPVRTTFSWRWPPERHGYGLLQEVASLTDGELQLGWHVRALHRMLKDLLGRRIRPPAGRGSRR